MLFTRVRNFIKILHKKEIIKKKTEIISAKYVFQSVDRVKIENHDVNLKKSLRSFK